MIGLEIHIDIAPGKRKEFLQTVETLLEERPVADSACADRAVFERHGAPDRFLWHENWEDREALEAHLASAEFRTLLGALRVLGKTHDLRIVSPELRKSYGELRASNTD
jgi:quinol monooxygenase YgiN